MSTIQIEGSEKRAGNIILDDIKYIQEQLNYLLDDSDKMAIINAIKETKRNLSLERDNSKKKTYYDKYLVFQAINERWFDLHKQYKNSIEAFELIRTIDRVTYYSIAYSQLFLSLRLINEDRTGKDKDSLGKIVSGFLLLSETIDVFIELFSIEELGQINDGAENVISVSKRDIAEYFEEDLETSNLVTQLRAYSSLIISKIEEWNNSGNCQKDKYLNWESQIKAMAEDSEIQLEINAINEEFLV